MTATHKDSKVAKSQTPQMEAKSVFQRHLEVGEALGRSLSKIMSLDAPSGKTHVSKLARLILETCF